MARVKTAVEKQGPPTIILRLQDDGLKVELVAWQHNAPVRLLEGMDVRVAQAIHQWRARFLQRETAGKTSAPTLTEQTRAELKPTERR